MIIQSCQSQAERAAAKTASGPGRVIAIFCGCLLLVLYFGEFSIHYIAFVGLGLATSCVGRTARSPSTGCRLGVSVNFFAEFH